jgi:hypothetical protein
MVQLDFHQLLSRQRDMKTLLDLPAIWRAVNSPTPAWYRLNVSIGVSVWRPRNISRVYH